MGAPYISATDDTGLQPGSVAINGNSVPTSRMINIKHYFGKNPKNMKYPRTGTTINANNRSIQILATVRNAHNVNYHAGSLELNITGEGYFGFKDC